MFFMILTVWPLALWYTYPNGHYGIWQECYVGCRSGGKKFKYHFMVNLRKVMIYLLTSCNTEERIAQNIYIHNSNRNLKKKKKINNNNNINQEPDRHRL